jgi:hypothetical protein
MQNSQGAAAPSPPAPSPTVDLVVLDDEALAQVAGSRALGGPGGNWSDVCSGPGGTW